MAYQNKISVQYAIDHAPCLLHKTRLLVTCALMTFYITIMDCYPVLDFNALAFNLDACNTAAFFFINFWA